MGKTGFENGVAYTDTISEGTAGTRKVVGDSDQPNATSIAIIRMS